MSRAAAPATGLGRPRSRLRVAALVAVVAVVTGACGIGVDRSPRVIDKGEQRDISASRQPDATVLPGSGEERIFFVADVGKTGGSRLRQVSREVARTPLALLGALFKGPTDAELNTKVRTAIPAAATFNRVDTTGDLVTVDLDATLASTGGDRQILAVAQIVYTLTSLTGVRRVQILVDGAPREWPTEDGTARSEPLTRFAYAELDPSTQPDLPPVPSPTSSSSSSTAAPPSTSAAPSTTIDPLKA